MTGANQISLRDIDEKFIEMIWDLSLIKYKKIYTQYFFSSLTITMKKFSGKLL